MVRWLALLLCGCNLLTNAFETTTFSGDPFPIEVETGTGAIVLAVQQPGQAARITVMDLMSPVTISDAGPDKTPLVDTEELQVLGLDASGRLDLHRADLVDKRVITMHPCNNLDTTCSVGEGSNVAGYETLLGADAMTGDAVRLTLGHGEIAILAGVAGDDTHRTRFCDGVFPTPFRGGGTMIVAGTELSFGNLRPTVGACLAFDPDAPDQSQRGADALLVASTGVGTTLLGESAYERYREEQVDAPGGQPPPSSALPMDTVVLPSGAVIGHRTTIPKFALVGASGSARSPCRQVYTHHLLMKGNCAPGVDCPCATDENGFCSAPAIVEVTPTPGLDVLVISDDDPTLQALRAELRPDQPEVDGILGTSAMQTLQIDFDYPHARLLMRCDDPTSCVVRPELNNGSERDQVQGCIDGGAGPIQ